MPPRPLYKIDPKIYLFGKTESPEEKVRQWSIFELLSTYGFNINDIQIEVRCKIGRKYFPADIVVYQKHTPYIVIECKESKVEESEEALKQAVSYANYLMAEFVVYTNGISWVVKRKVADRWVSVSDIPTMVEASSSKTITSTLEFVHYVKPLLYWVYKTIPQPQAHKYFSHLLNFYQAEIRGHLGSRRELVFGIDYLLCVLGSGEERESNFKVDEYVMDKMKGACSGFNSFMAKIGSEYATKNKNFDGYRFNELLGQLMTNTDELIKNQKGLSNEEFLLARMGGAISEYLWQTYQKKSYQEISPTLTRAIEDFLDVVLKTELHSSLPDPLDTANCDGMRIYTSKKWEVH
ncbi:MAG: type I restriction enzyme HsdR N-terminal domain-containing protein [Anaerolineales bacterium]|nr:type I restriction enzyme HsdR N-terminal domain-containing protein [Anaerolineales bacterium]